MLLCLSLGRCLYAVPHTGLVSSHEPDVWRSFCLILLLLSGSVYTLPPDTWAQIWQPKCVISQLQNPMLLNVAFLFNSLLYYLLIKAILQCGNNPIWQPLNLHHYISSINQAHEQSGNLNLVSYINSSFRSFILLSQASNSDNSEKKMKRGVSE